jgi:TatD DNase family protein
MTFELIDIGANLTNNAFRADFDDVLARARATGIRRIVVTGTSLEASEGALELARRHPGELYATAGVHPHHAKTCDDRTTGALARLASAPQVVALGECGLDYDRDLSPRDAQRKWFEAQLELAASLGMPVFLHERAAHDDFVQIVARHRARLHNVVVHCFTGGERELSAYLDLDAHIGITGWICDERRGQNLRELVPKIPASRLMIETDAPYLLPRTMKPTPAQRRNEPAFLSHVLDAVASAAGRTREVVALETTAVAEAFFRLPKLGS